MHVRITAGAGALVLLIAGCSSTSPNAEETGAGRVILVSNQPVDEGTSGGEIVADGIDVCADLGWETQTVVVDDINEYESTLLTAAREGYDIIATTFPPMTDATVAVADQYPDTEFVAIYQFINTDPSAIHDNIADGSFSYEQTGYLWGVVAATLSSSGDVGVVNGQSEPGSNTVLNGALQGGASVRDDFSLTLSYTNSYTDPAKGSENAAALINDGAEVIIAMADQSNIGVIDTAKESGVLVIGDTAARIPSYPDGIVATLPLTFGEPLADACAGDFSGGTHTVYPLSEGGADQVIAEITAWAEASGSPLGQDAVDAVTAAWEAITSGDVVVEVNADEPVS